MDTIASIAAQLQRAGATVSTAESCTGGLIGHMLTQRPGSSEWYKGGVVVYSNELKRGLLGVRAETLASAGAVSAGVAEQMALGARQGFDTQYAVSVTGIAGPGGGTADKPVGLTFVGVATPQEVVVRRFVWAGTRAANKQQSADAALALLAELVGVASTPAPTRAAVEVAFVPDGTIRPLALTWNGRMLKVQDGGRQWEDEAGTRHFLVMAQEHVWELRFDPTTLAWTVHPRSEVRHMA